MSGFSTSTFSAGAYTATSVSAQQPESVCPCDADVLVLCHTSQRRCSAIGREATRETGKTILLTSFDEENQLDDVAVGSRSTLKSFAGATLQEEVLSLAPGSRNDTLHALLRSTVRTRAEHDGRPLHVAIDMTCCPPFIALGFLSLVFKGGHAHTASVFYAEGKYPDAGSADEHGELFTIGDWDVEGIPGLVNLWTPGRKRLYVVAVGFEGTKTLRLCERREPDAVVVLLPDPGVQPGYVDRALEQNRLLFERFDIQPPDYLRAGAADVVSAWRTLAESDVLLKRGSDVEFLCCGTKPHSLAMAIHVLSMESGTVCDVIAERSRNRAIEEAGVFWRYDIENRAVV